MEETCGLTVVMSDSCMYLDVEWCDDFGLRVDNGWVEDKDDNAVGDDGVTDLV